MGERTRDDLGEEWLGEVARRLGAVLSDRKLSLRAAAALAGVDPATVSRIMRCERIPDVVSLWRLEVGLDVDLWPASLRHRTSIHD